ncbi:MAG: hypothetical protein JST69_14385 [Bacteroidetes bacterium]|nr:hypothetical protein [Bacteroidota bacterium]
MDYRRTMSAIEIKTELQQMIEREKDMGVLEAIRTILQKTSLDPVLKEKLSQRALKSETDIAEGRLLGQEEIRQRTTRK